MWDNGVAQAKGKGQVSAARQGSGRNSLKPRIRGGDGWFWPGIALLQPHRDVWSWDSDQVL